MQSRISSSFTWARVTRRVGIAVCAITAVAFGVGTSAPASAMVVAVEGSSGQSPLLGRVGTSLTVAGVPTKPVGFVAYGLGTYWGHNRGCGGMFTDSALQSLFASLAPHSLVRFDAFEGGLAVNPSTHQLDFTGLDRVFAAASRAQVFVIPVLANEWGGCDDGRYKDLSWFTGGYQLLPSPTLATGAGLPVPPLSYRDYVATVVARYAASPALGMWEPIGEPEATTCSALVANGCATPPTCPDQGAATLGLVNFFGDVGGLIHRLDPSHLVESGFLGGGQCGTGGAAYATVGASPGIDVLSFHDYYGPGILGGDQWNGIAVRLAQAQTLAKPLIDGEAGISASASGVGCATLATRASQFAAKVGGQLRAGVAAFLAWNLEPTPIGGCTFGLLAGDPAIGAIQAAGASAAAGT